MKKQFCTHGHDTFIFGRNKNNGGCKECGRIAYRKWANTYPEKDRESFSKWQKSNPEKNKEYNRKYYEANSNKVLTIVRKWQKDNPNRYRSHTRKNELKRLQRVPKFGQEGITEFYENCPIGYEVDHYYPLLGREGSGLHVIWNLRYLKSRPNRQKSNKWPKEIGLRKRKEK